MKLEASWDARLMRLPAAAEVLNRFHWNITVEHRQDEVLLRGGEILIASFPSTEELEIFTAGMALALSVLPESAIRMIDQEVGR
jgi:hypothetical protein